MVQQTIEPTSALGQEQRLPMSYEEYLAWRDERQHAEWIDGEVIVFMPPKNTHQNILGFLGTLLRIFVEAFDFGEIRLAPFEMRASPDGAAREPDLLFVKQEHADRLTEHRLSGPADLIIEIISDESQHRDRVDKFDEYEAAGIPEYWWIDPRPGKLRVKAHFLNAQGNYEELRPDAQGRYHSRVIPGFWVDPAWFWQVPLPKVWQALHTIAPSTFPAPALPPR